LGVLPQRLDHRRGGKDRQLVGQQSQNRRQALRRSKSILHLCVGRADAEVFQTVGIG
jgi:hypothetical protein